MSSQLIKVLSKHPHLVFRDDFFIASNRKNKNLFQKVKGQFCSSWVSTATLAAQTICSSLFASAAVTEHLSEVHSVRSVRAMTITLSHSHTLTHTHTHTYTHIHTHSCILGKIGRKVIGRDDDLRMWHCYFCVCVWRCVSSCSLHSLKELSCYLDTGGESALLCEENKSMAFSLTEDGEMPSLLFLCKLIERFWLRLGVQTFMSTQHIFSLMKLAFSCHLEGEIQSREQAEIRALAACFFPLNISVCVAEVDTPATSSSAWFVLSSWLLSKNNIFPRPVSQHSSHICCKHCRVCLFPSVSFGSLSFCDALPAAAFSLTS